MDKEARQRAEKEEEAKAFAQIDWDDFAVVQTIEFTSTDQTIDLPPPTTVQAMQMLNLNERRMAAMIVEENVQRGQDAPTQPEAQPEAEMEAESEDEETREQRRREQEELDRARAIQAKALGQAGMKIKKDYVPRSRKNASVATSICPYCKQAIPESEITEHIRIELLDPKWKEQKQLLDQKKTQAAMLLQNADVSASLKQLASARTDLFGTAEDEERRKKQEAEERAARKAKEQIVYDGHLASKTRTVDAFQQKFNLDEQIEGIHQRKQLLAYVHLTTGFWPTLTVHTLVGKAKLRDPSSVCLLPLRSHPHLPPVPQHQAGRPRSAVPSFPRVPLHLLHLPLCCRTRRVTTETTCRTRTNLHSTPPCSICPTCLTKEPRPQVFHLDLWMAWVLEVCTRLDWLLWVVLEALWACRWGHRWACRRNSLVRSDPTRMGRQVRARPNDRELPSCPVDSSMP